MKPLSEQDFHHPFGEEVKAKGLALFDEGKVRLGERRDPSESFTAKIPFFRRFREVWLERKPGGGLDYDCTCPHIVNNDEGCEHLYGLFLAINDSLVAGDTTEDDETPLTFGYWVANGAGPLRVALIEPPPETVPTEGPTLLTASGENLSRIDDESDRKITGLLAQAAGGRLNLLEGGGFRQPEGPWAIDADGNAALLEHLLARGSAVTTAKKRAFSLRSSDEALALAIRFEASDRARLKIRGWLLGEKRAFRIEECETIITKGSALAIRKGVIHPLNPFGATDWLPLLYASKGPRVPSDERMAFVERLAASGPLPRLWGPKDDHPAPLEVGRPTPRLRVFSEDFDVLADLTFLYGTSEVSELGADRLIFDGKTQRQLERAPSLENKLTERLLEGPFERFLEQPGRFLVTSSEIETSLVELLQQGFLVDLEDRPLKRAKTPRLNIREGTGKLLLEASVEYPGESLPLPQLLAAFRAGKRFIDLGDGSLGMLPETWLSTWDRLAGLGQESDDLIAFDSGQRLLIESLCAQEGGERSPLVERLAGLTAPRETKAPPTLKAELRPYQRTGLSWLVAAGSDLGVCLADEMGLGKTIQVLARLLVLQTSGALEAAPALIVVPRSLIFNWIDEADRFAPSLQIESYTGPNRRDRLADTKAQIVLTTYGVIRRDIEDLETRSFSAIILDEAHAIKNPEAQTSRAIRRLRSERRVAITGTPVENRAQDLWSLMEFLNPGLLGSARRFQAAFADPKAKAARTRLQKITSPLILRRTKEEVLPDLPEKVEQTLSAPMEPEQKALYESFRAKLLGDLKTDFNAGGSRIKILEQLLRLRQIACHPALLDERKADVPSGKVLALFGRLESLLAANRKAVLFSQFTSFLAILRKELEARDIPYAYLDGRTQDRRTPVQRFQEEADCPLILISLKAGGVGLNLTAADYVFLLDPWWNPAVEAQAIDRAHRIGRESRVVAYRLVSHGTIEEKILELQARKRQLAREILEPQGQSLGGLTADDLKQLLV